MVKSSWIWLASFREDDEDEDEDLQLIVLELLAVLLPLLDFFLLELFPSLRLSSRLKRSKSSWGVRDKKPIGWDDSLEPVGVLSGGSSIMGNSVSTLGVGCRGPSLAAGLPLPSDPLRSEVPGLVGEARGSLISALGLLSTMIVSLVGSFFPFCAFRRSSVLAINERASATWFAAEALLTNGLTGLLSLLLLSHQSKAKKKKKKNVEERKEDREKSKGFELTS